MDRRDETLSPTAYSQELDNSMLIIQDDIIRWMNHFLSCDPPLDPVNFFKRLGDGVILCLLAQQIHDAAVSKSKSVHAAGDDNSSCVSSFSDGYAVSSISRPVIQRNVQWIAHRRVNIENFLTWCRTCGINPVLLFDTNGLIYEQQKRNIVLTLYNVAKMCLLYDLETPQLLTMELQVDKQRQEWEEKMKFFSSSCSQKEDSFVSSLDEEKSRTSSSTDSYYLPSSTMSDQPDKVVFPDILCSTLQTSSLDEGIAMDESVNESEIHLTRSVSPSHSCVSSTATSTQLPVNSSRFGRRRSSTVPIDISKSSHKAITPADVAVLQIVNRCQCETTQQVWKLGEGIYQIKHKIVFLRFLRDSCMVRVGGGWQELSEFMRYHKLCMARWVRKSGGHGGYFMCRDQLSRQNDPSS